VWYKVLRLKLKFSKFRFVRIILSLRSRVNVLLYSVMESVRILYITIRKGIMREKKQVFRAYVDEN
jgi:hypothetical protein